MLCCHTNDLVPKAYFGFNSELQFRGEVPMYMYRLEQCSLLKGRVFQSSFIYNYMYINVLFLQLLTLVSTWYLNLMGLHPQDQAWLPLRVAVSSLDLHNNNNNNNKGPTNYSTICYLIIIIKLTGYRLLGY